MSGTVYWLVIRSGLFCLWVLWFLWLVFCVGCASPRDAVLRSIVDPSDLRPLSFVENEVESVKVRKLALEIESEDLTVSEILSGVSEKLEKRIVCADETVLASVVAGRWADTQAVVAEIASRFDLYLIDSGDVYLLAPRIKDLTWVVWSWPASRADDALGVIGSLKLCESVAVTDGGIVVMGVRSDRVKELHDVLRQLDSSTQWVVHVSIVDSWSRGGVFAALRSPLSASDASVQSSHGDVVDSYLLAVREGSERVQKFGARIPVQTSVVTENGSLVAGQVEYQEIASEIGATVSTTTSGVLCRVRVVITEPDQQLKGGLMSVSYEEIDSVVALSTQPVCVGKMSRWKRTATFDVGRALEVLAGRELRRYQVWVHGVRVK